MSIKNVHVLGFDIGGTYARVGVSDGKSLVAFRSALIPQDTQPTDQVHFIADIGIKLICDTFGAYACDIAGVALAAKVDKAGRVLQWPNRPSWQGLAFQTLLEQYLNVPLIIEDDVNAAALAEWHEGAGQGYRHLLVVMIGTGVGSGLILNNQLYRGVHGWAGELGHLIVQAEGKLCGCGRRGCLQSVASGRALEQIALAKGLSDPRLITEAALRGEEWATDTMRLVGVWLGIALANVVNLLDLEAVVVGGGLSHADAALWSYMEEAFHTHLLDRVHQQVSLSRAMLPDTAGLLGALYLAEQAIKESQRLH